MKPNFEQVPLLKSPYNIKKEFFQLLIVPWHIHPEYEFVFIRMEDGIEQVGSFCGNIEKMELLLLGPNLPHNWNTNAKSATLNENEYQIVIHFPKNVFGNDFFAIPSLSGINNMLQKAELGISFRGDQIAEIGKEMEQMICLNDFERSIALLKLLHKLSALTDYQVLSAYGFNDSLSEEKTQRMNNVFKYITINYKENISLTTISQIANMTPQAFCKYFKKRTNKTVVEFINEIKIGHACKLLVEDNFTIFQICYESGFNNLSNFNRQFKKATNMSPIAYKKKVLEGGGKVVIRQHGSIVVWILDSSLSANTHTIPVDLTSSRRPVRPACWCV